MLKLKELEPRTYIGKKCIGFTYTLKNEKGETLFVARFSANDEMADKPKEWSMLIVLDRTRDADSQVYRFEYIMPRPGLPLELIAATGLKYFQLYLKEEVQSKINLDFTLGEKLEGI